MVEKRTIKKAEEKCNVLRKIDPRKQVRHRVLWGLFVLVKYPLLRLSQVEGKNVPRREVMDREGPGGCAGCGSNRDSASSSLALSKVSCESIEVSRLNSYSSA
jgi:hypothetical protein